MTYINFSFTYIMGWHKEWRKLAKKLRRKRIRSLKAEQRNEIIRKEREEREKSPTHIAWLKEQEALEVFAQQEEQRLAEERQRLWEAEEAAAQRRWREQQLRLVKAHAEKAKQELLIREEWEREQKKIKEELEKKEKEKEEKRKRQEELLAQIDAFISGKADLPASTIINTETQPGHPECPFFSKTGACRFRDNCSRNHIRPGISRVLLFSNFYEHFGIQSSLQHEYDTDVGLEYDDSETYYDFLEFYNDILPEFESCGPIRQLKVCCNHEPHLRGNVYVEFFSERHALKAYQLFQGRYYAGRQLSVSFTYIPSWKNALCGLFHKQRCPKGRTCNFLHVFKNPHNAFRDADFDRSPRHLRDSPSNRKRLRSPDNWRWSESPERNDSERSEKKQSKSSSENKSKRRHRERSRERNISAENKRDSASRKRRRRKSKTRADTESSHRLHRHDDIDKRRRSKHSDVTVRSKSDNYCEKMRESKSSRRKESENSKNCSTTPPSFHKKSEKEERTPESG
ncbi:uncharacterized protein LOC142319758 [Lycorma delicatula]|uniref:uncharacterized protein LOC142319758 n=1 Tax=Lycorma delicatula TaxID=130591 RepID=UPI003F510A15